MPKLKRPPNRYERLQTLIYGQMRVQGETYTSLAPRTSLCRQSLAARITNPDTMTLGELRQIAAALSIPAENLRDVLPLK
jgi:hypothetical protein